MKRTSWSLVAVVAALAVACGGPSKQPTAVAPTPTEPTPDQPVAATPSEPALPAIPSSPVAAPDGIVAVGQLADARALIAAAGGFVDLVKPGMGGMVTVDNLIAGAAQEGLDLRGADLGKPVRVIVLNPGQYPQPLVAVIGVADEAAITAAAAQLGLTVQVHNGFAAVGQRDALIATAGYALTTLVASTAPAQPTIDVDVEFLVKTYGPMLDMLSQQAAQAADPAQRATVEASMRMYFAMFRQIDRLQMTLDLAGDHASVLTRMIPLPDTTLATFIAGQQPAQFAQLEQLPSGPMTMGGSLDLKLLWAAFGELMEPMMAQTYGAAAPTVMKFWKQWTELQTGESAISFELAKGTFSMAGLWELAQPAAAAKMMTEYFAALGKTSVPGFTFKIGKVGKVWTLTTTPTKDLPEAQRVVFDQMGGKIVGSFGVDDKRMVFGIGKDAAARTKALMAHKPGKKVASPALATVIADARRRNESYLVTFDMAALKTIYAPADTTGNRPGRTQPFGIEPGAMAIGVANGALTMRVTVPAAQVKALAD